MTSRGSSRLKLITRRRLLARNTQIRHALSGLSEL